MPPTRGRGDTSAASKRLHHVTMSTRRRPHRDGRPTRSRETEIGHPGELTHLPVRPEGNRIRYPPEIRKSATHEPVWGLNYASVHRRNMRRSQNFVRPPNGERLSCSIGRAGGPGCGPAELRSLRGRSRCDTRRRVYADAFYGRGVRAVGKWQVEPVADD